MNLEKMSNKLNSCLESLDKECEKEDRGTIGELCPRCTRDLKNARKSLSVALSLLYSVINCGNKDCNLNI